MHNFKEFDLRDWIEFHVPLGHMCNSQQYTSCRKEEDIVVHYFYEILQIYLNVAHLTVV